MTKLRQKLVQPGDVYNSYTVLGQEFFIERQWHCVVRCKCGVSNVVPVLKLINNENKSCRRCFTNGRRKIPDVKIGDKKGLLEIISNPWFDELRTCLKWRMNVKCTCGKEKELSVKKWIAGQQKSCGKCWHYGSNHPSWTGSGIVSGYYWTCVKIGAKKRNLSIEITIEEASEILEKQKRKCAFTGWDLEFYSHKSSRTTASLDRINSSKSYIVGNVQWLHKDVNKSKWNLDNQYFIDMCHLVNTLSARIMPKMEIVIFPRCPNFQGYGNISRRHFFSIQQATNIGNNPRGSRKNVFCEITIEEIWEMYQKQNGRCNLTGMPIFFELPLYLSNKELVARYSSTASLDRIDSKGNYNVTNCQLIHKNLNYMKSVHTQDYLLIMCKAVAANTESSTIMDNYLEIPQFTFDYTDLRRKLDSRTSKFKGVTWDKSSNIYKVYLNVDGKQYRLGRFNNEEEAAHNYDYHVIQTQGKNFVYLNFPDYDYSSFVPKKEKLI